MRHRVGFKNVLLKRNAKIGGTYIQLGRIGFSGDILTFEFFYFKVFLQKALSCQIHPPSCPFEADGNEALAMHRRWGEWQWTVWSANEWEKEGRTKTLSCLTVMILNQLKWLFNDFNSPPVPFKCHPHDLILLFFQHFQVYYFRFGKRFLIY